MDNVIFNEPSIITLDRIPDGYISLMLQDPPYGSTTLKWDKAIDYELYFSKWWRVMKENGAIIIFSHQPFATDVINACRKYFRYEIIWQKTQKTNFPNAKKMPLRGHENILIFYRKLPIYNPQKYFSSTGAGRRSKKSDSNDLEYDGYGGGFDKHYKYENLSGMMYPDSIIKFSNWNGAIFGNTDNASIHPTQKPVDLFRWLIKTYSNEGDVVFDGFMGSGTTAIACIKEKRTYIGSELDEIYFNAINKRITAEHLQPTLF